MKKLISLSASIFMVAAMAMAQDTIPPPEQKNFPDSNTTTMDSMRTNRNTDTDTSSLNQNNKWPDTSMNRNRPDTTPSAMNQPGTTTQPDNTSQADSTSASTTSNSTTGNTADRVIMKDDKVMVVRNGDSTLLADSIRLESGALVTKDGTVTYTSGKAAQLKNGQYVSLSATADNSSQSDSSSATTKATDEDKVIMVGEKVYVIKSGDSTVLADSIKLSSGAIVKNDASVTFKDGTTTTLKNGQYIALNPAPAENKSTSDNKTTTDTPPATTTTTTTETTATTTTTAKPVAEDRVVMRDDQMFVIKNGIQLYYCTLN
ncbi:MAG: DUF6799 domain-containing protein [Ferruginibacter sp.]